MSLTTIIQKQEVFYLYSAKIAVFSIDIFKSDLSVRSTTVTVFEKSGGCWEEIYRNYVNLPSGSSVSAARDALNRLLDGLGDCRIAVGAGLTGVLYRALDIRGFSIFDTDDISPGTLNGILADLKAAEATSAPLDVPVLPAETETPGAYELNLIRLQETHPEISSKQALREFLEATPFCELRLICAHIPPWLASGPYDIASAVFDGVLAVTVRKKNSGGKR
jgi:hypothetical protein